MAWEWVAPVVTGVVGVAGVAGTVMSGRRQANVTVQLAREERVQARLEQAYQEVQRVVDRSAKWAVSALPFIGGPGQDLYPLHPEDDDHTLEASALRLYWSPEVRRLVEEWTNARNRLVIHVSIARTTAEAELRDQTWMKAPEMKQALRDAEDALVARMSHELLTVEPVRRRWRPQVPRWRRRTAPVVKESSPGAIDGQRAAAEGASSGSNPLRPWHTRRDLGRIRRHVALMHPGPTLGLLVGLHHAAVREHPPRQPVPVDQHRAASGEMRQGLIPETAGRDLLGARLFVRVHVPAVIPQLLEPRPPVVAFIRQ
jgi:hypothetical protein